MSNVDSCRKKVVDKSAARWRLPTCRKCQEKPFDKFWQNLIENDYHLRIFPKWEWLSFAVENESQYQLRMNLIYKWEWLSMLIENVSQLIIVIDRDPNPIENDSHLQKKLGRNWEFLSSEISPQMRMALILIVRIFRIVRKIRTLRIVWIVRKLW